jgi:hypothetical protein
MFGLARRPGRVMGSPTLALLCKFEKGIALTPSGQVEVLLFDPVKQPDALGENVISFQVVCVSDCRQLRRQRRDKCAFSTPACEVSTRDRGLERTKVAHR